MRNNREERVKALNYAGIKITENYMKDLVGRKVLCTQSYAGVTKGKEYEIVYYSCNFFTIIEDNGSEQKWSTGYLDTEQYIKLIIDEFNPKQGDKVLISDCNVEWSVRTFIVKHNNLFYCEGFSDKKQLVSWKYIKPYEEEIKVGDWVKRNNEIIKVYETPLKKDWIKITDQDLINKLNEL